LKAFSLTDLISSGVGTHVTLYSGIACTVAFPGPSTIMKRVNDGFYV